MNNERIEVPVNENTTFVKGTDDVLGKFFDIKDSRYADSIEDLQGEGYVFEWSQACGITTNHINAQPEDVGDEAKMLRLVETFIQTLNQGTLV